MDLFVHEEVCKRPPMKLLDSVIFTVLPSQPTPIRKRTKPGMRQHMLSGDA
jgi:hypothetical protein